MEKIGVPEQCLWNFETQPPRRLKKPQKSSHVPGKTMLIHPPQAHVQKILLSKTPAIAFEVRAKVEFGNLWRDRAAGPLLLIHFEFDFLCDDHGLAGGLSASEPRHRAEVATRAYHQPSPHTAVRDPLVVVTFQS